MFSRFERLLKPTDTPERAEPPPGFIAFFWHFARQAKRLFAALWDMPGRNAGSMEPPRSR